MCHSTVARRLSQKTRPNVNIMSISPSADPHLHPDVSLSPGHVMTPHSQLDFKTQLLFALTSPFSSDVSIQTRVVAHLAPGFNQTSQISHSSQVLFLSPLQSSHRPHVLVRNIPTGTNSGRGLLTLTELTRLCHCLHNRDRSAPCPSSPPSQYSRTGDVSHGNDQQSLIYGINYARCDCARLWRR